MNVSAVFARKDSKVFAVRLTSMTVRVISAKMVPNALMLSMTTLVNAKRDTPVS